MAEFTGERLVPGQVDVDLLNEHLARYTFAARLARGKRVLDAGCGTGYGSAELAHSAFMVTGADIAAEAVDFAREHYRLPNLHFVQATCGAMPHPDGTFDLIVAFEVIEHLAHWREFLLEVRRVMTPGGQFVVSTPNKLYYTESRGNSGANPFHVHEFEFEEFRTELTTIFPHVSLFLENHVEAVTFQPYEPGNTVEVRVDASEPVPPETHFFVAVCAHRPQLGNPTFVYVPRAGNVLRERGRHIALLEEELATKNEWLEKSIREHETLLAAHRQLEAELQQANRWAESLNQELDNRRARVVQLQEELRKVQEAYAAKVRDLEQECETQSKWGLQVSDELRRAVEALHKTEHELEERTHWALRLDQEGRQLEARLGQYQSSRWMRLGRRLGLGPEVPPR